MPSEAQLAKLMRRNNPKGEPVGHFTGRCSQCGSKDLWDDNATYGCNCCGTIFLPGGKMLHGRGNAKP